MPTTILIVEANSPDHVAAGDAGATSFVKTFEQIDSNVVLRIIAPNETEATHADFDGVDGVVFTGSTVTWSVDSEEEDARRQRGAMRMAFSLGLPCWGSCNGMQMAAVVLGGQVGPSPNGRELGVAKCIEKTKEGQRHPMLSGRPTRFAAPCIHRDEVQILPRGAVLLAGNGHSKVQAFSVNLDSVDFWGTQYHPEISCSEIAKILRSPCNSFSDSENIDLVSELENAHDDPKAAARLGTFPAEMKLEVRSAELVNWLAHVRSSKVRTVKSTLSSELGEETSERKRPNSIPSNMSLGDITAVDELSISRKKRATAF